MDQIYVKVGFFATSEVANLNLGEAKQTDVRIKLLQRKVNMFGSLIDYTLPENRFCGEIKELHSSAHAKSRIKATGL